MNRTHETTARIPPVSIWKSAQNRAAFSIMEVVIAGVILAVGFSAVLGSIASNNNLRIWLNEQQQADTILCNMMERLEFVRLGDLGHVYTNPDPAAPATQRYQGWTLHMRATESKRGATPTDGVMQAIATPQKAALNLNSQPPYRPLDADDLLDYGIIFSKPTIAQIEVYVEYYCIRLTTGSTISEKQGLFYRYQNLQINEPTSSAEDLWHRLVGNPRIAPTSGTIRPMIPTDPMAPHYIMPATFSLQTGSWNNQTDQLYDANNNGVIIRILVSWVPRMNTGTGLRQWRETSFIKRGGQ